MSLYSYFKKSSHEENPNDCCSDQSSSQSSHLRSQNDVSFEKPIIPDKRFKPDKRYSFPFTLFGERLRSCQAGWFDEYQWLHYDISKDKVFCLICMKQDQLGNLKNAKNKEGAFIKDGFNNWKNATVKLAGHQSSKCHELALTYHVTIPQCADVLELSNKAVVKRRMEERKYFLKVIECVQFLARQGLAFRGSDSAEENFRQLMILRCKDYPELLKRVENEIETSGKKYLHQDYQNELLTIMSQHVLRRLLDNVTKSQFFAIMCDEYTDISNKEQLSFCVRWVEKQLKVHEAFIGFYEIANIKSDTIVNSIKDILLRLQLSLENCRGQTYDGASNMVGRKSGVATQITAIQPKALATHCHGHSVSLSVKDVTSQCKLLRDTMGTVGEMTILVKFSPKREKMLGTIKENIEYRMKMLSCIK